MNSRTLLNLAMLAVVAVLVIIVVTEPGKKHDITPPLLTSLTAANITTINISRRGKPDIELVKNALHWKITKPYQLPANSYRIESILGLLSTVSFYQHDLSDLNEKDFGVDNPELTVSFNHDITISFGHNKHISHHRYVKIGHTLHLIQDTFYYQLAARAESFIDHSLLPAESRITQLQLPGFTLLQQDGKWQLHPPRSGVTTDSMLQLISEWQNSQAYEMKKITQLAQTNQHIIIDLADGTQVTFGIVASKEDFILQRDDVQLQYILPNDRKDKLLTFTASDNAPVTPLAK